MDRAAIGKAWQLAAHFGSADRIDIDEANAGGLAAHVQQDFSPGIDRQAVTVRSAAILVLTDLRGRDDESAGFHRAGALEQVPVRLTSRHGEGCGGGDHVALPLAQRLEQGGKRTS